MSFAWRHLALEEGKSIESRETKQVIPSKSAYENQARLWTIITIFCRNLIAVFLPSSFEQWSRLDWPKRRSVKKCRIWPAVTHAAVTLKNSWHKWRNCVCSSVMGTVGSVHCVNNCQRNVSLRLEQLGIGNLDAGKAVRCHSKCSSNYPKR
jgi:hypothetical protein